MADGASAIIGIVAFGLHVVHRVIEIVEEIRDAPGDILALQDDAVEVGYLLRQLQQSGVLDTVVIPPGRATRASVDRLKGALEEIKSFVEAVSEERRDGALRVRKIKLFLKPGRCQKLRGNLTSLKSSIIAIVTASTSKYVLQLREEHRLSREQQEDYRRDLLSWLSKRDEEFAVFQNRVLELLTAMALGGGPAVLTLSEESSAQSRHFDSPSPNPDIGNPLTHTQLARSHPHCERCPSASELPLQCHNACECRCHDTTLTRASPYILAPVFGNLFLPRSFFYWSFASCDVQTCRRRQRNCQMTTLKYFFPSWFIAVDMKIRLESFPVQFCLQTPRRVSRTSPLFLAIAHSDIEGVRELLLSHRGSVNDVDPHGRGVLHYAGDGLIYYSYKRVTKMLELLVGAGAHTEWEEDEFQRTPLQFLQYQFNRRQHARDADLRSASVFQLHIAGPMFHQDAHDALEDWVNRFDLPEIHRAVLTHRGQDTTLKDTLASTTDINMLCPRGWTPLEWGIRTFVPGVVDILLECGADLRKGFPLHQAALRGNIDALKSLIHFGADVNLPDKNGRLPLHYAAYRGETNIVEELVRVGGDNFRLDAPDHRGRTVWDEYRQGRIWYTGLGYPPLDHDRVLRILSDLQASRFEADPRRLSPDRTLSEQGHRDESHKDEDDSDITMPGSFPKD